MMGYFVEGIVMAFVVGAVMGTMLGLQLQHRRGKAVVAKPGRRS